MSGEPVVLRTYGTEMEAELARVVLDAEGIAAIVQSQNAAGMLLYVQGVQLLVRRDDAEAADAILRASEEEDTA